MLMAQCPTSAKSKFLSLTKKALNRKLTLFYTGMVRCSSVARDGQCNKTHANLNQLNKMGDLAVTLKGGKTEPVRDILHQGWALKKNLASKISNPKIDGYYEHARKAYVAGGKILSAGVGGFLLLYCEESSQENCARC